MEDVVVVTMSEFGRTAHENGNRGTDHGHANCMFVMAAPSKAVGIWKMAGTRAGATLRRRDLALTTDFRSVLGELIQGHLGAKDLRTVSPALRMIRTNSRVC